MVIVVSESSVPDTNEKEEKGGKDQAALPDVVILVGVPGLDLRVLVDRRDGVYGFCIETVLYASL